MGSFNVSCSASRISINCGMKVAFIPLLPNVYDMSINFSDEKEVQQIAKLRLDHHVGTNTQLIYANCYYNPFCLPIIGTYDDYGSIGDIEKNDNTEAIEKFFGFSIEDFINVVGNNHDAISVKYAIKKFNYKSDKKYSPDRINELGFELVEGKENTFIQPRCKTHHIVLMKPTVEENDHDHGNYNVKIVDSESGNVKWESENNPYDIGDDVVTEWEKHTKHLINFKEEDYHKILLLRKLSGMFIHYDIFTHIAHHVKDEDKRSGKSVAQDYLKEDQLQALGFNKITDQWVIDSHHDILYRKEGFDYDIKVGSYGSVIVPMSEKEYACLGDKRFVKETKNIWEKCTKTKVKDTFPEPAPKEGTSTATNEEWKAICNKFEELTGVRPRYSRHADKKSVYSLKSFIEEWKNLTNEELDITKWENYTLADKEYDGIRDSTIEFRRKLSAKPEMIECTHPSIEKQKKDFDSMTRLLASFQKNMVKEDRVFEPKPEGEKYYVEDREVRDSDNPWSGFGAKNSPFLRFYEGWDYFQELYEDAVVDNKLRAEFKLYKNFYWGFYSVNGFFFPAQNGEQFGNYKATKSLADKMSDITLQHIREYAEDEHDD